MRKLFGLLALSVSMSAFAQASAWNISEVAGKDKSVVGYIYHSSAVGTQVGAKTEKVVSGLRLVCSTKGYMAMKESEPIIAVFWNGMFGNTPETVLVEIDGKPVRLAPSPWDHDNQILFRKISESKELLQGLKTGRSVTFSWTSHDAVKRKTTFSLRDFNSQFSEFNASCKTQI